MNLCYMGVEFFLRGREYKFIHLFIYHNFFSLDKTVINLLTSLGLGKSRKKLSFW